MNKSSSYKSLYEETQDIDSKLKMAAGMTADLLQEDANAILYILKDAINLAKEYNKYDHLRSLIIQCSIVYNSINQPEKALNLIEDSLDSIVKHPKHHGSLLNLLAGIYKKLLDYPSAMSYCFDACKTVHNVGENYSFNMSLVNLQEMLAEIGEFELAASLREVSIQNLSKWDTLEKIEKWGTSYADGNQLQAYRTNIIFIRLKVCMNLIRFGTFEGKEKHIEQLLALTRHLLQTNSNLRIIYMYHLLMSQWQSFLGNIELSKKELATAYQFAKKSETVFALKYIRYNSLFCYNNINDYERVDLLKKIIGLNNEFTFNSTIRSNEITANKLEQLFVYQRKLSLKEKNQIFCLSTFNQFKDDITKVHLANWAAKKLKSINPKLIEKEHINVMINYKNQFKVLDPLRKVIFNNWKSDKQVDNCCS